MFSSTFGSPNSFGQNYLPSHPPVLSKIISPLPLGERVWVRGPFSPEPFITHLIAWIECVLSSIQFYDHFPFEIHKIHNIPANWLLATKLETFYLSVSEVPPEMLFCMRRVFSKFSCYARQFLHPHPFPSPLKGEGFPYLSVFFRVVFHNFFDVSHPPPSKRGRVTGLTLDLMVLASYKQGQTQPIRNLKFMEDGRQMRLDGSFGNVEPPRNILIISTAPDQQGNLLLSEGQIA